MGFLGDSRYDGYDLLFEVNERFSSAFASWPNMAFDLCGIACGHFGLSFWTFFGATFVGKALIKVNKALVLTRSCSLDVTDQVNLQACFFIVVFNAKYLSSVVSFVGYFSS